MIGELNAARDAAEGRAGDLARLVADVEALHEPDAGGDCPTCMTESPCRTLRRVRREITFAAACDSMRDLRTIDLAAAEDVMRRPVPTLKELLETPAPGLERFFHALLGDDAHRRTA